MKTEIRRGKFLVVWVDTSIDFIEFFFVNSETMTPEQYISELKDFIKIVKEYKPKIMFGDMTDFKFTITVDTQEWLDNNLFPVYAEIGFKKIAIISSTSFIAELSIEQAMDEDSTGSFQTKYFDNRETAMDWLLA